VACIAPPPPQAYNISESVLTASLATVVLPRIADVLEQLAPAVCADQPKRIFEPAKAIQQRAIC
jgi:hypothetical protein